MTTNNTTDTNLIQWVKTNPLLTILWSILVVLLVVFIAVMVSENLCWISPYLGLTNKNEILTFLGIGMGGILLALQAVIANSRAQAMANAAKEQAKANQNTEQGQRQERLKAAIEHLGHASDSVRLGGAYELFHLAQDTEDLRQTVMDILCAHIRRTTGESEYREKYKSSPSEEVQSLLTLLFVQEHTVFKGCHINLRGSWLKGVDFKRARLQGANFAEVHLQGAELQEAKLQGANLVEVHMQVAELREASLHGARLENAYLQGTFLEHACLHGADLKEAKMQVAYLHRTQLQGTSLWEASLQGATLSSAQLQGSNLWQTRLQGANLNRAHLEGVHSEDSTMSFAERIRGWISRESESDIAIFEGGLSREDVNSLVEVLPNENLKTLLRQRLNPHIDREVSYQIPETSSAITEAYTKEEAEKWIAEYEEAMSEVPKTAKER